MLLHVCSELGVTCGKPSTSRASSAGGGEVACPPALLLPSCSESTMTLDNLLRLPLASGPLPFVSVSIASSAGQQRKHMSLQATVSRAWLPQRTAQLNDVQSQ